MGKFSRRSRRNLKTCDEKLQRIAYRTLEKGKVDFTIIQGMRSKEEQKRNVARGVSWTMNSKHCKDPSEAFDYIPYPFRGWNDKEGFERVGKALLESAKELNIKARWGGDWNQNGSYKDEIQRGSFDGGHFELM